MIADDRKDSLDNKPLLSLGERLKSWRELSVRLPFAIALPLAGGGAPFEAGGYVEPLEANWMCIENCRSVTT